MEEKGYLCIVLHGHLPYVRHPEFDDFLEEDWFYEAVTETYIPLINVFEGLLRDGVDFRVVVSLSPTLLCMFNDPLLQQRCQRHINMLIELAHKEIERTRSQPEFNNLAHMYLQHFENARHVLVDKYKGNLVTAFKGLLDSGKVEVITCAGTHGYLPLMDVCKESVRAQIKIASDYFQQNFGQKTKGIWLPECGYNPGDDEYLKQEGIRYFFVDSHGILHGKPRPKYGVFAPVYCKSGVACFGRDMDSSKQVWSAVEGYPGDYYYREFYRDIGFDLDYDYIKPYIHKDGIRVNTGIKYYRITGKTGHKEPYQPQVARDKASYHAGNFMFNREKQIEFLQGQMGDRLPMLVSPYDAELYGHWWYEGPQWLDFLMRKASCDQDAIRMITPSEYLSENPRNQVISPSMSSWGWKGYSEMWLQGPNDWIYRHLHASSNRMTELVKKYPCAEGLQKRALNQALRELLLAQSSDWAFIMGTGTHTSYAVRRTKEHVLRFGRLYEDVQSNSIDEEWLADIEYKDNIFPNIDYRVHQ